MKLIDAKKQLEIINSLVIDLNNAATEACSMGLSVQFVTEEGVSHINIDEFYSDSIVKNTIAAHVSVDIKKLD